MSPKEPIDFAEEIAKISVNDINEARTRQIYNVVPLIRPLNSVL